jgi:competence protein ComEC
VSPAKAISFFAQIRKPTRQPMLWAALAYGVGIVCGVYAWRPALWWVLATVSFLLAGLYFAHRRWWLGFPLGLLALFAVGALTIQVRPPGVTDDRLSAFAGGEEVFVTAHVVRGGKIRQAPSGELRQSVDVEIEEVVKDDQSQAVHCGLRLGIYAKEPEQEYDEGEPVPMRVFHYGKRLRFAAKLRAPRNFRNPGAFDYRGYLADRGIVMLASTKSSKVEMLPGFVGTRLQWSASECTIASSIKFMGCGLRKTRR